MQQYVFLIDRELPSQLRGLHSADRPVVWNSGGSPQPIFKSLGIVSLEVDSVTAAQHKIAGAVQRVGKTEARRDAEIVVVEWIVRRAQTAFPDEVRAATESVEVEHPDSLVRILRVKRLRDEVAEAVVTNSQVQHQLAIDAPVVLRKEAEVDEAPR